MKFWGILLFVLLICGRFGFAATGSSCGKATSQDSSSINNWYIHPNIDSLNQSFKQAYSNKFRLRERVYKSDGQYLLPSSLGLLNVPLPFIKLLSKHMTLALKNGYADYIFYPDMGHVHIFVPEDTDDNKDILAREDLLFLYHTGELVEFKEGSPFTGKLKEDPWLQWRYYSRNFIGDTRDESGLTVLYAKGETYNTVRRIDGYKQAMTLYFSSHQEGCFQYKANDREMFFDLSLRK